MINYMWTFMIILGVLWGGVKGPASVYTVSTEIISSAKEAVELGIMMLGVVGMWSGVMRIAEDSGLTKKWAGAIAPAIDFLFPDVPKNHPVRDDICVNMIANIMGLGYAATPAGLKAMRGLQEIERERFDKNLKNSNRASNSMCTLLVLNISSLQLIPINIIAYRTQYLSVNATGIIGPAIVATTLSTLTAVFVCRFMSRR